ncbi:MAG: hypothetical protein KC620_17870, partial [Myxococcales bacterium]|nr:hypothetical protein [Myxococcales bacterium]
MLKTVRLIGPWFILAHVIALHVFIAWFQGPGDAVAETQAPGEVAAPEAPVAANEALGGVLDEPPEPEPVAPPLVERPGPLDPDRIYVDGAQTLAELDADWLAELTLDPELQATATRMLTRGKVPFGAVVVVDVKTGDVLAMADRYDEQHAIAPKLDPKGPPHLALRALAPAASVFKMVTAAALIESGVSPSREFAYKTGSSKIYGDHLEDLGAGAPKTDMIDAFADSNNGFFARLADQKLSREAIELMARRFGF